MADGAKGATSIYQWIEYKKKVQYILLANKDFAGLLHKPQKNRKGHLDRFKKKESEFSLRIFLSLIYQPLNVIVKNILGRYESG